jgi:predicted alpha/beta superfamily hydrolase
VSHYAIAQYPEVFSKAGVFSPAWWTAQPSFEFVAARPVPKDARIFMLRGEKEGDTMVRKSGHPERKLVLKIVPGAQHNEGFWSGEFRGTLFCVSRG